MLSVTAWADAEFQASETVGSPEHIYKIRGGQANTSYYWGTAGRSVAVASAADFAFFKVDNTENQYYVYCVTDKTYLSYNKSNLGDGKNKAVGVSKKEDANPWQITVVSTDYFQLQPIGTNGTAATTYANWYGGPSTSFTSIGLYGTSGNNGNAWTFETVDESNTVKVTYNVNDENSKTLYTLQYSATAGNAYPTPSLPASAYCTSVYYSFSNVPSGNVSAAETKDVTLVQNTPFKISKSFEDATWYSLRIFSSNYNLYYTEGETTMSPASSASVWEDTYMFCFVGDVANGFAIYNKAAGSDKVLSSKKDVSTDEGRQTYVTLGDKSTAEQYLWDILNKSEATNSVSFEGFLLAQHGNSSARMNLVNSGLAYWTGGSGARSTFTVVEDPDLTEINEWYNKGGNIGYPSAASSATTGLKTAIDNFNTTKNDANATAIYDALNTFKTCSTDIVLPEDGKAYKLYFVANNSDKTKYGIASSGNSLTFNKAGDATSFYCHKITNVEGNERFVFVDENGKLLKYQGLSDVYSVANSSGDKRLMNDYYIEPLNKVTANVTSSAADRCGYLYIGTSARSLDNANAGVFVYKFSEDKNDGASAPFHNANFSSAITIENVADFTANDAQKKVAAQVDAIVKGYPYAEYMGEGTGKYTYSVTNPSATGTTFANFQSAINATTSATDAAGYTITLNQPTAGYYYFKNKSTSGYVCGNVSDAATTQTATDKSAIFYIDSDNMVMAYDNGAYWKDVKSVGNGATYKSAWTFEESGTKGLYCLKTGDNYAAANSTALENGTDKTADAAAWELVAVTDLPLTIGSNGWSTFSAPVPVTIPEGKTAYYAPSLPSGGKLQIAEITGGIIPANTGVIISGTDAESINISTVVSGTPADLTNNKLVANVAATSITGVSSDGIYAFVTKTTDGNEVTGFMKLMTTITLPGHKCYLNTTTAAGSAEFIPISLADDPTGIESAEATTVGNSDAPIYDLQGRKVNGTKKGGMYIQNGKVFIAM